MSDSWRRIWGVVAWVLTGLLAALAVLLVLSALNVGVRSYTVSSGSMSPALSTGSLVFVTSEKTYKPGDVITFKGATGNKYVTHRIVKLEQGQKGVQYVTKGDVNQNPDEDRVPDNRVMGKVVFHIPRLGYLMAFLRTKTGLILFMFAIVLLLLLVFVKKNPADKEEKDSGRAVT